MMSNIKFHKQFHFINKLQYGYGQARSMEALARRLFPAESHPDWMLEQTESRPTTRVSFRA